MILSIQKKKKNRIKKEEMKEKFGKQKKTRTEKERKKERKIDR